MRFGRSFRIWAPFYDNPVDTGDWLQCLPLLDPIEAKEPNGSITELGVTMYTPGNDTTPLTWVQYMTMYGIDPACALIKMGRKIAVGINAKKKR